MRKIEQIKTNNGIQKTEAFFNSELRSSFSELAFSEHGMISHITT